MALFAGYAAQLGVLDLKLTLIMLNTFFAIAVGAACAYALIKLAFGG